MGSPELQEASSPTRRATMKRRRRVVANLRYLGVLAQRFRLTLALAAVLFLVAPLIFRTLYVGEDGRRIRFGEAFHHVYFLLFGQPSLPYTDSVVLELLNFLIPPVGIALIVDGLVRFAYLYFAKHRSDKEWMEVMSKTLSEHIVICGAGRVGYRVAEQLLALGQEIIVVEKREDAAFVQPLRDRGVPVLVEDIRGHQSLSRTNIAEAASIVCATDDDLANLNVALDARRVNPRIRVVMRLFDEDLVQKVRTAFKAEALSSSAVAAPAMALAALDPRIVHSFRVGGHLMVVSEFLATKGLPALRVADLRDRYGALTLSLRRGQRPELLHPNDGTTIEPGDILTLQAERADYLRLRELTGESVPPPSIHG